MRRAVAAALLLLLLAVFFRLNAEATRLQRGDTARHGSRGFHLQVEDRAHLRVSGTHFVTPHGARFEWRGITAFRLVEFVAHGKEGEADAYLRWAASKKLTLVRVLVMADGLFKLSPEDGRRALSRLLELAQKHGLYVEVVALADTAAIPIDIPQHVKAVAEIAARHANALLEIANEPVHPTQVKALHDPAYVQSLAKLVPAGVPFALGAAADGEGFHTGTYVTWHAPRTGLKDWPAEIARGAALIRKFKKPVIDDEPMGAGDEAIPGRRDSDPRRFREAARASTRAGLGATFHYEGGLQAKLPSKIEAACLDAWLAGLSGR